MRKIYDHQHRKVLAATAEAFCSYKLVGQRGAMTRDEMLELFIRIKNSEYFEQNRGDYGLKIGWADLEGKSWGVYFHDSLEIFIEKKLGDPHTLCHEVAHHLAMQQARDVPHHGPTFCMHFLNLVYLFVGKTDAEGLKWAFDEHEVDYFFTETLIGKEMRKFLYASSKSRQQSA